MTRVSTRAPSQTTARATPSTSTTRDTAQRHASTTRPAAGGAQRATERAARVKETLQRRLKERPRQPESAPKKRKVTEPQVFESEGEEEEEKDEELWFTSNDSDDTAEVLGVDTPN